MAGGPLFIDKNHPELKFVSPVSGVVTSVERGARRKVLNIVVKLPHAGTTRNLVRKRPRCGCCKEALLQAGLFAFIRNVRTTLLLIRR